MRSYKDTKLLCPYWKSLYFECLKSGIESIQLTLGGIGTCYNNNIDKYGTKGGGKGCRGGKGYRDRAPVGLQGAKSLVARFGRLCPSNFNAR